MARLKLLGNVYGELTVIERLGPIQPNCTDIFWMCECSCGEKIPVRGRNLLEWKTHCGCLTRFNEKQLLGQAFGRLTVLLFHKTTKVKKLTRHYWWCQCDCGNPDLVSIDHYKLLNGHTKSCGCILKEMCRERMILFSNVKEDSHFHRLLENYVRAASNRNLSFDLTAEEFKMFTKQRCYYCNVEPYRLAKDGSIFQEPYVYNGVDRIDNSIGYTLENCCTACWPCNKLKWSGQKKEFQDWAKRFLINNTTEEDILSILWKIEN